jgi:TRAP-type mannitol/chloroaromatic compound transport system substrate-binding protein
MFFNLKERKVKRLLLVVLALMLAVALIAAPAMAKKVNIKCQQCYSSKLPGLGTGLVWMSKMVKEASDGNMNIKIYEPGKLVKCFEVLDAVSRGQIDAGWAGCWLLGRQAARRPDLLLHSLRPRGHRVFGLDVLWQRPEAGPGNVRQGRVQRCGSALRHSGPRDQWLVHQAPSRALEDLKGMKMRFYGLGGQAMQKLGMSITLMPAGELFPALEKKVIDATEFSMPSIDRKLGFYKLAKYNYFPGWHQQATIIDLLINKKKWNKLSKGQQAFLKMASMASITNSIAELESEQGRIIKENEEKMGVNSMYWSQEMLDTFKEKWHEVAAEQSSKDPMFKKVLDDLQNFRSEYKYWGTKGFLPRNCK